MQLATTAAATLLVDAVTAEAAAALRAGSIPTVLLRGRAIAHHLYRADELRVYGDADLLVPREAFDRAELILRERGFREAPSEIAAGSERPGHAHTWINPDSAMAVDLHFTLIGVGISPERVWETLAREVESLDLDGVTVQIPGTCATALIVALHAWQHAALPDVPLEDLRRAIRVFPEAAWTRATELARELDALAPFVTGLRMDPRGAELADTLGLGATDAAARAPLRGSQAFHIAQGLDWMARERGVRSKALFLWRKWFPPSRQMRALYPTARRGAAGLAASYVWRTGVLAWHTPGALLLRRRARRARASQY